MPRKNRVTRRMMDGSGGSGGGVSKEEGEQGGALLRYHQIVPWCWCHPGNSPEDLGLSEPHVMRSAMARLLLDGSAPPDHQAFFDEERARQGRIPSFLPGWRRARAAAPATS